MDGLVEGTTHLCQGQEAVSVGAINALGADDYLTITYRGHGQALARGMSPEAAFAELIARKKLVRVLADWCPAYPGFFLYYPSRRQSSPAFALLVGALRYRS